MVIFFFNFRIAPHYLPQWSNFKDYKYLNPGLSSGIHIANFKAVCQQKMGENEYRLDCYVVKYNRNRMLKEKM